MCAARRCAAAVETPTAWRTAVDAVEVGYVSRRQGDMAMMEKRAVVQTEMEKQATQKLEKENAKRKKEEDRRAREGRSLEGTKEPAK